MNQILSQNEVDALLSAVAEGALEEEEEEAAEEEAAAAVPELSGEVKPYDLTSQERIFRGKMPMLDVIHEKFCRDFGSTLSMDLGRLSESVPTGTRLLNFQEFLNGLPLPSCLSLFKADPLPGNGVVVVETQFVFTLVDIFCGGTGASRFRIEGRDFSSIELGIVRRIVKKALNELARAWKPVYPVDVSFIRTEINPQFVSIAHPSEVVIIMESKMDVEGATGTLQIVIPYAMVEPIKDQLAQSNIGDRGVMDREWKGKVRRHILDSSVEVKAVLGTADLTIRQVLNLKEGQIITLDRFSDEPADLLVEGIRKFRAESGVMRGYKALQIVDTEDLE